MKTKILKKINQRIRIIENSSGTFEFQTRKNDIDEWVINNTFVSHRKALDKKHNHIVMIILRDLGLRGELISRRTKRERKKHRG